MHPNNLDLQELLVFEPNSGAVRFAGQRALVVDAVSMGLLRKYLVEDMGEAAARVVLTQFGFAQGWRMAEAMQAELKCTDRDEWRAMGTRMQALEGLFGVVPGRGNPLSEEGATLIGSYEAEQHLLHFGSATQPICWTICGIVSGYLSRTASKRISVVEDRCTARGDPACHLIELPAEMQEPERPSGEQDRVTAFPDLSMGRVTQTLRAANRRQRATRPTKLLPVPEPIPPSDIVTKSAAMLDLLSLARRVASVDATVLITGPSGAGKERIARLIHQESARSDQAFVAVNCGAITDTLLESELFGHARGAFTGATHDRAGLFEAASGGTLLLDEIGEVSADMQVKLLRVLQEREVRRVGENRSRKVDVRVLAATNRDLTAGVSTGGFRKDLYYRLRVVELKVPALSERGDDILPLARTLLADAARRMARNVSALSPSVADQLVRHPWPGNVRELENAMEHAVAVARGSRVELEDLPAELRDVTASGSLPIDAVRPLRDIEKEYILAALEVNDGNQTRTAKQLHVGTATLYRKLKSYGLVRGRGPPDTDPDCRKPTVSK